MSILKIFFLVICLLLPATLIYADEIAPAVEESTAKIHKDIYHFYDDVSLSREVMLKYGEPKTVMRATYPLMASEQYVDSANAFNALVSELIKNEIDQFKARVVAAKDAQKALGAKNKKSDYSKLYIDYSSVALLSGTSPLISVRFNVQGFVMGEAHPTHTFRVLNYNTDTMQTISLGELFLPNAEYLTVISQYCRNVLSKSVTNQSMLSEGTAPEMKNFENWNFKPNGILITFNEGTIAPYVYGAKTVLVPYTLLKSLIDPTSQIAGCVAHEKTCMQNNMMTGGFIDQA